MPIAIQCACGKSIDAPERVVGKTIACPACKNKIKVPIPIIQTLPIPMECSCGVKLEVPSSMAGKNIDCPICKKKMKANKTISHEEPIRGACDHCNHEIEVSVDLAGKRIRCPSCKQGKISLPKAIVASTPVHTKCVCGRIIDAPGEMAGKKIRCPSCKAKVRLPRALVLAEGQPPAVKEILSKPEIRKRLEQDITITLENVPFYRPQSATPAPVPFLAPTSVPNASDEPVVSVSSQSPLLTPEPTDVDIPILKVPSTSSQNVDSQSKKEVSFLENPIESPLKNPEARVSSPAKISRPIPVGTPRRNKIYSYERKKSQAPQFFIFGSIFLCACLAFYFTYFKRTFASSLQYIPDTCNVVGAIHFNLLFNIPEFAEAIEKSKEDPQMKGMRDAGFAPENLVSLHVGGKFDLKKEETSGMLLFLSSKAPMNLKVLLDFAKSVGFPMGKTESSGYSMYHPLKNPELLIGQLEENLLIAGSFSMVNAGISAYYRGNQNKISPEMLSLIQYDRSDLFWLACVLPKSSNEASSLIPLPIPTDKISKFLLSLNYDVGILLDGKLVCVDTNTAYSLKEGLKEMITMNLNPKTGLKEEHFQVSVENNEMDLRIEIPESILKKTMGKSLTPEQLYALPELLGFGQKKSASPISNRPKVSPLPPQNLSKIFPTELLELKNAGTDYLQSRTGSSANGYYKKGKGGSADRKEEQFITISIEDLGETEEVAIEAKYPWIREEIQKPQEKTKVYQNMRAFEKVENETSFFSVLAGTRFVVTLEGKNIPMANLKKTLNSINLKELDPDVPWVK